MRVLTTIEPFPDPGVRSAAEAVGLRLVADTIGRSDVMQGLEYEADDGSYAHYLFEPELGVPLLVVEGPSALRMRDEMGYRLAHTSELALSVGYDASASVDVKVTLLRLLSAHALETTTPGMVRAVTLAVHDPSPFVRIGAAQVLQYAHEPTIAEVVRTKLGQDTDPDVREFALRVLETFDASPPPDAQVTPSDS